LSIIKFENVSYSYLQNDKPALQNVTLSVMEGEFLAVMGENTAGKTTFCKLINGLIPHFTGGFLAGAVLVDNQDVAGMSVPELACTVGMVLDDPDAQLFTSSVRHEAAFGPENLCLPVCEIKQRTKHALFSVGLDGFEDRLPSTLSGGEKQRLSIAAALAMKSKILVLDEPLRRLDPQGALEVMAVLKDLQIKHKLTIVMAEHSSAMMAKFADRVCVLKNGRITALDNAKTIFVSRSLPEENGIQPLNDEGNSAFFSYGEKNEQAGSKSFSVSSVPSVLDIVNFSFSYQNNVNIENINLKIAENDFAAIMGRNGCGKTTLFKNITGLLRPLAGDIFIRGKNTKELSISDISKEIGYVMQNPDSQLFTNSVYKEVSFALKNMRLSKREIKQRVEDALETVGLYKRETFLDTLPRQNHGDDEISIMDVFPHALNKADRTKLVIACVLAMGTKIILFDEVDAGDYQDNLNIMNAAKALHKKGYTIIFVTHNEYLANNFASRIIKMDRNGIIGDAYL